MSGLPPMELPQAAALYSQAKTGGAESLLILTGGDERNLASVALRALVLMGDRVVELEQQHAELAEILDELRAVIHRHVDNELHQEPLDFEGLNANLALLSEPIDPV